MNDCPNADVRDLLPDLLHDRLDEAMRAMVESHVQGCADCRAELALLRDVRAALRQTPVLNIAAITAAVPSYRAPVRRSWVGWRVAAAVTLVAAGGSSLLVMQRDVPSYVDSSPVAVTPVRGTSTPLVVVPDAHAVAVAPSVEAPAGAVARVPRTRDDSPVAQTRASGSRELGMAGSSLTDLNDRELASLLEAIESLDALPSTDVESAPISPIAPRRGTP